MKISLSLNCVVGVFLLFVPPVAAQSTEEESDAEVVEIPLEEIWAWWMPGTKNIAELEPDKSRHYAHGKLVGEMRRALKTPAPEGEETKPGFAAQGTGLEALQKAHSVLVEGKKAKNSFPGDSEISVVFFSQLLGRYVHFIDQCKNNLTYFRSSPAQWKCPRRMLCSVAWLSSAV
jgi:hypothetical protein